MQEKPNYAETFEAIEYAADRSIRDPKEKERIMEEIGDKLRELDELEKKYEQQKPEHRNFSVEVVNDDAGKIKTLLIKNKEGAALDVGSYLPKDFVFRNSAKFACDYNGREIHFPAEELGHKGSVVALFHEIGHAHVGKEEISFLGSILAELSMLTKLLASLRPRMEVHEKDGEKKRIFKIESAPTKENILPLWLVDESAKFNSVAERKAHAYALKELRKIEKDGFEVFSDFKDIDDLQSFIDYFLYRYEVGKVLTKFVAGGIKALKKDKPLYYKKTPPRASDPSDKNDIQSKEL